MCIITLTVFCPQDDWTALHLAAQEVKIDVVRLLINAEAHVNIQTEVRAKSVSYTQQKQIYTWNVVSRQSGCNVGCTRVSV